MHVTCRGFTDGSLQLRQLIGIPRKPCSKMGVLQSAHFGSYMNNILGPMLVEHSLVDSRLLLFIDESN